MSEIRKHYFLSEYCIIAEGRAKRPSDFAGAVEESGKGSPASCFFCGGAEENTPLATAVYKNGKSMKMPLKKEYAIGISAAFRTFTQLFLLILVL